MPQPDYEPQRPIIVDDDLGSPETAALRYEEEALRANGGDYRGPTPPGLLPMATFKPQPAQLHGQFVHYIVASARRWLT
jgi:hypothetical protein